MSHRLHLLALLTLPVGIASTACGAGVGAASNASEDALIEDTDGTRYSLTCKSANGSAKVVLEAHDGAFDLKATAGDEVLLEATTQLPSLNVRIEDGESTTVNQYVDFHDKGLDVVPVDGPIAIELGFTGDQKFSFKDANKAVELTCDFSHKSLLRFLKIYPVAAPDMTGISAVGFDIDDTLAFSTPTFVRAFATGGTPAPGDVVFWTQANGCDPGCPEATITLPDGTTKLLPANAMSTPKSKALEMIALHKSLGHRIYAITARPDINGDPLRDYIEKEVGIERANVFFEPEIDQPGNPAGKTDRIENLNLDLFYGDSDSDITDTRKAFVHDGVRTKEVKTARFFRSPKSSNRKAGKLNKYHPGYYGEPIIAGSYE